MTRVKRGMHHTKRRRGILEKTKGFEAGRKNLIRLAKVAAKKAGGYAFKDRKIKKRTNRGLWQVKINAAARLAGTSYSRLMGGLHKANIALDRKVLSAIADKHPETFKKIVAAAK